MSTSIPTHLDCTVRCQTGLEFDNIEELSFDLRVSSSRGTRVKSEKNYKETKEYLSALSHGQGGIGTV